MLKTIVLLFFSALVESEARPLALEENEVNHDSSVSSRTGFFQIKWDSQKNWVYQRKVELAKQGCPLAFKRS